MEKLYKTITQENIIAEPKIKDGVDFVFEQNPELEKIGTREQYSEYLDTIFPESKVKDIVYHGTAREFKEFELVGLDDSNHPLLPIAQIGFYFAKTIKHANIFRELSSKTVANNLLKYNEQIPDMVTHKKYYHGEGGKIISALLNMNNIKTYENNSDLENDIEKNGKAVLQGFDSIETKDSSMHTELIILNSEQIHILGSKQDIEGFREFVENKK